LENRLAVMLNLAGLAVHQMAGTHNLAAERGADGLMSQADAKQRDFSGEVTNQSDADPGLVWSARTRGDYDSFRGEFCNLAYSCLVIAGDDYLRTQLSQILHQVVGKRIVVIQDKNHGLAPQLTAVKRARAGAGKPP